MHNINLKNNNLFPRRKKGINYHYAHKSQMKYIKKINSLNCKKVIIC